MPTVFITGDRSIHPIAAAGLVNAVLLKHVVTNGGDVQIATGTENGVEASVRYGAEFAGLSILTFETPLVEGHEDEGWKDFAKRAKNVLEADENARFVVLHNNAQGSRITKAIFEVVPEDQIELVTPSLV